MLGDIDTRQVYVVDGHVRSYPGHDNVVEVTLATRAGKQFTRLDFSAVDRFVAVYTSNTDEFVFDTDTLPDCVVGNASGVLTMDLSQFNMPETDYSLAIIAYDTEHPQGQVVIDGKLDSDAVINVRLVSSTGTTPPPSVDYVTDVPNDDILYGRRNKVWVPIDDVVAGVSSVNGETGTVVLNAADVGADPTGTASSALADHVAAADPHSQYLLQTEGDARYERVLTAGLNITIDRSNPNAPVISATSGGVAPVTSVNSKTGDVVLSAGDVGADPTGTATSTMSSHLAAPDPHNQYTAAINTAMEAALTTGMVQGNNGPYLTALTSTSLRIEATTGLYFESELGALGGSVKGFPAQTIALNTLGLVTDGLYIRYVALDADGVATFSATPINSDPTRVQLGLIFLSKSGATVSFINGTAGPLNVLTMPILANVNYTQRAQSGLAARLPLVPNTDLTIACGEGRVTGEAINWGDLTNVNIRTIAAANPMSFLLISAGLGGLGAVPAPVTTIDPTQYWNGTALVTLAAAGNASVQRILVSLRGTIIVQYGELSYANLDTAYEQILVAPFTDTFPAGYTVEVARLAIRRGATNLRNNSDARMAIFGSGLGAGGGGGGGAVDSVNGQTGTVVLDSDDVGEGTTNLYFTSAERTKLSGIETGAQVNVATNLAQGTRTTTTVPITSSTGTGATLAAATTSLAGVMSAADKTKLDGIATGATQNSADAFLLARANHTGTQAASTISDFNSAARAQTEAELVAGTNVTITPSGSGATRQLTISATGGSSAIATQSVSSSGGVLNLSATTAPVILVTLTENITSVTLPAGVAGQSIERRIVFTQAAGNYTVPTTTAAWGGIAVDGGGAIPQVGTGAGTVGTYVLANDNAGTWRMYIDAGQGLGTAASANVTTSTVDTTPDAVLQVNDFGVGSLTLNSTNLLTDLNTTALPSGTYAYGGGATGAPNGSPGVLVVQRFANSVSKQIARTVNGAAAADLTYERQVRSTGPTYEAWQLTNVPSGGATSQYLRGDKTWRDFLTDVHATVLTGISFVTTTAVVATDNVLQALGKLQAQINGLSAASYTNLTLAAPYIWDSAGDGATYSQPSYAKVGDVVRMRGKVTLSGTHANGSTVTNTTIATLPVGFRPLKRKAFVVFWDTDSPLHFAYCLVFVNTDGTIVLLSTSPTQPYPFTEGHLPLDQIWFDLAS